MIAKTFKTIDDKRCFSLQRSYEERVAARIAKKYSFADELAIIRQKETKPEEFLEYYQFVENIKQEEKVK